MLYNFTDTTEVCEGTALPSEALKINGEYLEIAVQGYRTLYTKGRESLERTLNYYESDVSDGGTLWGSKIPPRTITVGFQLAAQDNESFRFAYRKLFGLLSVDDSQLIFRDEADVYYTGSMTTVSEPEPGRNIVNGEIEFTCLDPFKYSVAEHSVLANADGDIIIGYRGTAKSRPVLQAEFGSAVSEESDAERDTTGDCGYVAFSHDEDAIVIGDMDELDEGSFAPSQTLTDQQFASYSAAVAGRWPSNTGVLQSLSTATAQVGTLKVVTDATKKKRKMLTPDSYGTGTGWHGPSITRTLPAQASGHQGSKSFTLTWQQRMCASTEAQRGIFMCTLLAGSSSTPVAAVAIVKSKAGNNATIHMYANGTRKSKKQISLNKSNRRFGYASKAVLTSSITKQGQKVSFNIGGIKFSVSVGAVASTEVTKACFYFGKASGKSSLYANGLYWARFRDNACETWADIPNKFAAGDVVQADCNNGRIYLNGAETPEYGAVDNNFEGFALEPGVNTIKTACSDWVKVQPKFSARYREAYL